MTSDFLKVFDNIEKIIELPIGIDKFNEIQSLENNLLKSLKSEILEKLIVFKIGIEKQTVRNNKFRSQDNFYNDIHSSLEKREKDLLRIIQDLESLKI